MEVEKKEKMDGMFGFPLPKVTSPELDDSKTYFCLVDVFATFFKKIHWDEFREILERNNITPLDGNCKEVISDEILKDLLLRNQARKAGFVSCKSLSDNCDPITTVIERDAGVQDKEGERVQTRNGDPASITFVRIKNSDLPAVTYKNQQWVRLADVQGKVIGPAPSRDWDQVSPVLIMRLKGQCKKLGIEVLKLPQTLKCRLTSRAQSCHSKSLHAVRMEDLTKLVEYSKKMEIHRQKLRLKKAMKQTNVETSPQPEGVSPQMALESGATEPMTTTIKQEQMTQTPIKTPTTPDTVMDNKKEDGPRNGKTISPQMKVPSVESTTQAISRLYGSATAKMEPNGEDFPTGPMMDEKPVKIEDDAGKPEKEAKLKTETKLGDIVSFSPYRPRISPEIKGEGAIVPRTDTKKTQKKAATQKITSHNQVRFRSQPIRWQTPGAQREVKTKIVATSPLRKGIPPKQMLSNRFPVRTKLSAPVLVPKSIPYRSSSLSKEDLNGLDEETRENADCCKPCRVVMEPDRYVSVAKTNRFGHRSLTGKYIDNLFVTPSSLCIRCSVCQTMFTVRDFMTHDHDVPISDPRLAMYVPGRPIHSDYFAWQAFQIKVRKFGMKEFFSAHLPVDLSYYNEKRAKSLTPPPTKAELATGARIAQLPLQRQPNGFLRSPSIGVTDKMAANHRSKIQPRTIRLIPPMDWHETTKLGPRPGIPETKVSPIAFKRVKKDGVQNCPSNFPSKFENYRKKLFDNEMKMAAQRSVIYREKLGFQRTKPGG